jgi:hypothetical protein
MFNVSRMVDAGQQEQWSIDRLFPDMSQAGVPMTVRVALNNPGLAYASLVDNTSTDAVTYVAKPRGRKWIIPIAAHNPGADETFWRSDLAISNLTYDWVPVSIEYLPEMTDNSGGGKTIGLQLAPNTTIVEEDIVKQRFRIEDGKGVLIVTADDDVVVGSRVYTTTADGGTTGHGVPSVNVDALSTAAVVLPGIRTRQGFRTNVGVVTGDQETEVRFRLYDQNGVQTSGKTRTIPARTVVQWSVKSLFSSASMPNPVGSVAVDASAEFFAYVVVLDGSSQDPAFFLAER